jgi:hypothetical protein
MVRVFFVFFLDVVTMIIVHGSQGLEICIQKLQGLGFRLNAEIMIAKMSRHERAWGGECERRERLSIPASFKRGLKDSLYFSAVPRAG